MFDSYMTITPEVTVDRRIEDTGCLPLFSSLRNPRPWWMVDRTAITMKIQSALTESHNVYQGLFTFAKTKGKNQYSIKKYSGRARAFLAKYDHTECRVRWIYIKLNRAKVAIQPIKGDFLHQPTSVDL